jgi:hypothetical protein
MSFNVDLAGALRERGARANEHAVAYVILRSGRAAALARLARRSRRADLDRDGPVALKAPPLGILLTFIWLIGTSIVLTRRALRGAPRRAVATA